jgi:signal peptidase I
MKKLIISWTLPFLIATAIILIIRVFFIDIQLVSDDAMKNTLIKRDKVVCLHSKSFDRNTVVLVKWGSEENVRFKRLVALPHDTILLRHSILYVNQDRVDVNDNISFTYSFSTDSIQYAAKLLNNENIAFNPKLATIGVFQFNADLDGLKSVKTDSIKFQVKRIIEDPAVSLTGSTVYDPSLYWNKDNMGPFILPGKGTRARISARAYYLYKQIIEKETGGKLELQGNIVYLSRTPLDFYTFKQNYYFLLNDNRQDVDDSRTKGFISEDQFVGKFWFKLPW